MVLIVKLSIGFNCLVVYWFELSSCLLVYFSSCLLSICLFFYVSIFIYVCLSCRRFFFWSAVSLFLVYLSSYMSNFTNCIFLFSNCPDAPRPNKKKYVERLSFEKENGNNLIIRHESKNPPVIYWSQSLLNLTPIFLPSFLLTYWFIVSSFRVHQPTRFTARYSSLVNRYGYMSIFTQ